MAKNEKTGKNAGHAASKVLRETKSGKDTKSAAGSALSQTSDKKGPSRSKPVKKSD